MLKNKKETLRKIMNDKKTGAEMCQFFCEKNLGIITCLHYNYMRMSSYNEYKNAVSENLFKRYETFHYNSLSNKCKTKTTKLHSNEPHLQKHKNLSKED